MPAIPFPTSSAPGQRPGEHQGRLINCLVEPSGEALAWKRAPGFVQFADTTLASPRGMIDVNGVLYGAWLDKALTISSAGTVTQLTGSLTGNQPVTWARNNKQPTPDVVVVSENGAFSVSGGSIISFADADLPFVNSADNLSGYILFTTGDGRLFATGLNAVTVDALSFTTCQANPDGLTRVVVKGQLAYAFGTTSCEVFQDVGASPFPLSRVQVIDVGLLGPWAVAGNQSGWDQPLVFVAQDGTVRLLSGYDTATVSTPDVERAIQNTPDVATLKAFTHVIAGHPIWTLSSPSWTWSYDLRTKAWHERKSAGVSYWRASQSVKFQGRWMVGDIESGKLFELSESSFQEDGDEILMRIESAPIKQFPQRVRTLSAVFDFTAVADPLGSEAAQSPQVGISWSHDGAASWSGTALSRSLGVSGDYRTLPRVNRCGISTGRGTHFRLDYSAPVYASFRGGDVMTELRAP